MNRRKFVRGISTLATVLPPMPHIIERLRAPKDEPNPNKRMRRAGPVPRASIKLTTTAPGLTITGIEVNAGIVKLDWVGGTPPFAVLGAHDLGGPYAQIGNSTLAQTATFPAQDRGFLRLIDNVSSVLTATPNGLGVHLSWTAPDLPA